MTEGKLRALMSDLGVPVVHKNSAGWLITQCPFAEDSHQSGSDRNPSFCIKVNDAGYSGFNCFTCKQRGNLSDLINKLGDLREEDYSKMAIGVLLDETPEDFEDFDERWDGALDEGVAAIESIDADTYLRMYPMAWDVEQPREYLEGRGIGSEAAQLLDLRYDPDDLRILFPVYGRDHKLYGFTGRTILGRKDWPHKKYPKVKDYAGLRKKMVVLGEQLVRPDLPFLVVEGLFALAHMVDIGVRDFCNPIATMGSHMSDSQRDLIIEYGETVFMLYDMDNAGDIGLHGPDMKGGGALDLLAPHVPTFYGLFPEDTDDPDDLTYEEVRDMVLGTDSEPA